MVQASLRDAIPSGSWGARGLKATAIVMRSLRDPALTQSLHDPAFTRSLRDLAFARRLCDLAFARSVRDAAFERSFCRLAFALAGAPCCPLAASAATERRPGLQRGCFPAKAERVASRRSSSF